MPIPRANAASPLPHAGTVVSHQIAGGGRPKHFKSLREVPTTAALAA
jgi:hypothetical protein